MSVNKENASARISDLIKMTSLVSAIDLGSESILMTTKWADYRFMSPWGATLLFGKTYQTQFRKNIEMHVDRELAPKTRGTNLAELEQDQKERIALWRARQRADIMGMKYEDYISICFEFAMNRQRKAFPRPSQLHYSDKSEQAWCLFVSDKWEERVDEWIVRPEDLRQYRIEHFQGLQAQLGYRDFILKRSLHGSKPLKTHIRRHSLELNQVPIESFELYQSKATYDAATESLLNEQRAGEIIPQPCPEISDEQLWQSCFGVKAARDFNEGPCGSCPQAVACGRVAEHVSQKVKERCGFEDPLGEKKREQSRIRVRRHREKKQAEAQA